MSEKREPGQLDAHDAALRDLISRSPLAGPDPEIIEAITHQDDADQQLREAAAAEGEVDAIYRDILTRNPEHDFEPTITRVARACELLGDPQRAYPVIHIAGTNGKTSTARMVEALLAERGLRVGRFTSPHLHDVRERIVIDGEPISAERFVETYREIEAIIDMTDAESVAFGGPRLSFFEVFTLMAFAAFASAPVDVAVIEVGMGGRFDATNVVDPVVSLITPIARDHERYLGENIEAIAAEKAGIIKPDTTVVSAHQREEAAAVLTERAAAEHATFLVEGRDLQVVSREVAVGGQFITLQSPQATYTDIMLGLHGAHQAHNALLALAGVEAFFGHRTQEAAIVERAFLNVASPGRLEVVSTSPTVVVDAAHNPHGVAAVMDTLAETFNFTRLVAVIGALADKNVEAMLSEIEPHVVAAVVSPINSVRALDVTRLEEIAGQVFDPDDVHVAASLPAAITQAVTIAESGNEPSATTGVIVLGSVYLAAAAREVFHRRKV
ncbi:MAG: folylpolyglutamate synthase/dihydrofolate synthase family protein [Bowdeniella nasicola]|nr:folylpolyglutamate synthase/dihydrofolate synthase family protein [Bowdeniella nasicola]